MGEWEEKLNSILENQDAMGQIMALARSLSGDPSEGSLEPNGQRDGPLEEKGAPPDLSGLFEQLDPEMLQRGMRVIHGLREGQDRNTALLLALKPFLKEERQNRIDRALQILQLTRIVRLALGTNGGKEGGAGV